MSDSELAGSFDWSDFEVDAEFLDCFFPGFRPTAVFFFVGGVAECALDSESESLRKQQYFIKIEKLNAIEMEETITYLELVESVDDAVDDSDDFSAGFSGGFCFGGLPLCAGGFDFVGGGFFVGVSSSLSDELSGEKMLFFFELAGDLAFDLLFVLLLLLLFRLAAALFIC